MSKAQYFTTPSLLCFLTELQNTQDCQHLVDRPLFHKTEITGGSSTADFY